jgi:hypothetical protein
MTPAWHLRSRFALLVLLTLLSANVFSAHALQREGFAPLERWRAAVLAGDAAALEAMYVHDPRATFQVGKVTSSDPKDEVAFWSGFKAKGLTALNLDIARTEAIPGSDARQVVFTAELVMGRGPSAKRLYVNEGQLWGKKGAGSTADGGWIIAGTQRTEAARLAQPIDTARRLYPAGTNAKQQIAAALASATREHKRVLVVFGADWCFDCHVLDKAFERADIAPLLKASYRVVHVDIGKGEKNQDIMKKYDVPMEKGIPAIAVLDASGKLLYSQRNGEFESARGLGPEDLLAFLHKWQPRK